MTENSCSVIPDQCSEHFINTDIGILISSAETVHYLEKGGNMRLASGKTTVLRWETVDLVYLGGITFQSPTTEEQKGFNVIHHNITYDEYIGYSFIESYDESDIGAFLNKQLFKYKVSLDKFKSEVNGSPFISDVSIVIIVGVILTLSLPSIFAVAYISRKVYCTSVSNARIAEVTRGP